jgi:hypothetical protein
VRARHMRVRDRDEDFELVAQREAIVHSGPATTLDFGLGEYLCDLDRDAPLGISDGWILAVSAVLLHGVHALQDLDSARRHFRRQVTAIRVVGLVSMQLAHPFVACAQHALFQLVL